jgi:tellurite resistance protein
MDDKTARRVCQLVASIVAADGSIDPAEEQFVARVLRWFNLFWVKREDLDPLPPPGQASEELQRMTPELQRETFELMVQAVAADRRYVEEERAFLLSVAGVIGIPATEVDARVGVAITNAQAAGH